VTVSPTFSAEAAGEARTTPRIWAPVPVTVAG
jgi:hypothetical protein